MLKQLKKSQMILNIMFFTNIYVKIIFLIKLTGHCCHLNSHTLFFYTLYNGHIPNHMPSFTTQGFKQQGAKCGLPQAAGLDLAYCSALWDFMEP